MNNTIPTLRGECNRCGACCTFGALRCHNLRIDPTKRIGDPGATYCGVYALRYDGLPILLVDGAGVPQLQSTCVKGGLLETIAVAKSGFGAGCSMRLAYQSVDDDGEGVRE